MSKLLLFAGFLDFFRLTSGVSIFTSKRRVEIQTTSEMTPYFTMTKSNKLHTLLAQLNTYMYQLFHSVFQPLQ